jgi:GNAT superfamily N-acetyltransferase
MAEASRIRPARLSDARSIARLTGELGYAATNEEIATRLALLLGSALHFVAVAETPGATLSGWISVERRLTLEAGERAELTGLVVTPAARRKGIGRNLLAAAEQWAAALMLPAICVRSNIARTESHGFYLDLDYLRKKTQHVYEKRLP